MNIEFVETASFFKSTLAELYNNEGQVPWNVRKLTKDIAANKPLLEALQKKGYTQHTKSFTAEQVELIFEHLSRPILNKKNKDLLKIPSSCLLDNFENNPSLLDGKLEDITKLSDATLSGLGLRYKSDVMGSYYVFNHNIDIYLYKRNDGFEIHEFKILNSICYPKDTKSLIIELLKLRKHF